MAIDVKEMRPVDNLWPVTVVDTWVYTPITSLPTPLAGGKTPSKGLKISSFDKFCYHTGHG